MSLNWNISKVAKYANIEDAYDTDADGNSTLKADPHALIFWLGVIGLTNITRANAPEVYGRSKAAEEAYGLTYRREWQGSDIVNVPLSMEVVREHIGLSTNWGDSSTTEWATRVEKQKDMATPMTSAVVRAIVAADSHRYEQWSAKMEVAV